MKTIANPAQLKLDLFQNPPIAVQNDRIPEVQYSPLEPVSSGNIKLDDKLEKLAASMQKSIESKLNPSIGQQNITARRSRIAAAMRQEGEQLALVQRLLKRLAQSHCMGTCPPQFAKIDNRKQVTDFATIYQLHKSNSQELVVRPHDQNQLRSSIR